MWPFKKNKKPPTLKVAKSILCIPGPWNDFEDFQKSLILNTGAAYMVVGNILIAGERQRHFTFEFCERDEKMKESFACAGKVTAVTEEFLDEIDKHNYVIYITAETGNLEETEHIAQAGNVILKAGGTGIKIESTGKAFEKSKWSELMEDFKSHYLYDMFVLDSITNEDGTVFSCGMHNLGLKDTVVSGLEFHDAVDLIRIFGFYQMIDKPIINNNQTFQKDIASPFFRIIDEPQPPYKGHETFDNPFGMWRLTKI